MIEETTNKYTCASLQYNSNSDKKKTVIKTVSTSMLLAGSCVNEIKTKHFYREYASRFGTFIITSNSVQYKCNEPLRDQFSAFHGILAITHVKKIRKSVCLKCSVHYRPH